MKTQMLETLFVLGCSLFGLVSSTPVGDHVRAAVRYSITQPPSFAPQIRVLKLDLPEALCGALTSLWLNR
jgi:hypothetical protein